MNLSAKTNIDIENLFSKGLSVNEMADIIMRMNTSSSRHTQSPLTFSFFVNTPNERTVELSNGRKHYHIEIPQTRKDATHAPILHNHDYFELMFVRNGTLKLQIENTIYTYHEGDACLFDRNIHHAEVQQTNTSILYCCITKDFLDNWPECGMSYYPKENKLFEQFFHSLEQDKCSSSSFLEFRHIGKEEFIPEIFSCFLAMRKELEQQLPGYWLVIYGLFCRLLNILIDPRHYKCDYVTLKLESLVDTVRHFIESSSCRLTRQDISAALHYNSDYLNRLFKENMGMTLSAYCSYTYIKKAASLLLQTDDTVEKIAETVGFKNPSQFYRQFQKHFHMTPQEYRNMCMNLLEPKDTDKT